MLAVVQFALYLAFLAMLVFAFLLIPLLILVFQYASSVILRLEKCLRCGFRQSGQQAGRTQETQQVSAEISTNILEEAIS
jgi:hypothetical protein